MKVRDQGVIDRVKKEAAALVSATGVKGWTMADLASRSGLSKDTLYRMFPAKERIVREIVLDGIARYQTLVGEIAGRESDYGQALKDMIGGYADFVAGLQRSNIQAAFLEYPALEAEIGQASNEYYGAVISFLESGKSRGFLKPDLDSSIFVAIINACTLHFLKHREQASISADIQLMAGYLLDGVIVRPGGESLYADRGCKEVNP